MARINSKYYLKQTDYPNIIIGTGNKATTIAKSGCGVCCLAMFLLNKSGKSTVTSTDKTNAITAIINAGFLDGAYMNTPAQSRSVSFNSSTYTVAFNQTSDVAAGVQNGGIGFMRIYSSAHGVSHFVFVDGVNVNSQASINDPDNLKKHLVVDPSYGTSSTLYDAMQKSFEYNGYYNITPSDSYLETRWKCLFS